MPTPRMKLFDEKCFELAQYFMPDATAEIQRRLAAEIQQAVDDFYGEDGQ